MAARQHLGISFVDLCSRSWSAASRIISTAANHFGALGAGSLSGVNLPMPSKPEDHAPRNQAVLPSPQHQDVPVNLWQILILFLDVILVADEIVAMRCLA
ncbi:MAG: hypothetical protein WBW41_10710 [Verrucomicrobiia bacterium]